jgi:hypothetical protein
VGTITTGDWFCTANDVADATLVKVATLANLQAAGMVVIGCALTGATNASFNAAIDGDTVDSTVHGMAADPTVIESGYVVLNTATGRARFTYVLEGDDVELGVVAVGTSATRAAVTVRPNRPTGKARISILDPRWGARVLTNGRIIVDGALAKIHRRYAQGGGTIDYPRRHSDKFGTSYYVRDDEIWIDWTDLGAGDFADKPHGRYPILAITHEGDGKQPFSSYTSTLRNNLRDFGFTPNTENAGKQMSILEIDTLRNTMRVSIPLDDILPPYTVGATYTHGMFVRPSSGHTGKMYRCLTTSFVAGAEPTWGTVEGDNTGGGGGVWECFNERPSWPIKPREWVDHYLYVTGGYSDFHTDDFLVLQVLKDGSDGNPVELLLAMRGSGYLNFPTPLFATGTAPPIITTSGTATIPLDVQVEITLGGSRGTAEFRYSIDGTDSWVAGGPHLTAASFPMPGTGVTLGFASGTYTTDNVYEGQNMSGNDRNNGSIRWRLRRFVFQERTRHNCFHRLSFYADAGYFVSGWHYWTQSPEKGALAVTKHKIEDCYYSSYPPGSYRASLGMTGFSKEVGNYNSVARDWFVECGQAVAFPIAALPGNGIFIAANGEAGLTAWAAGAAITAGDVRRPTGPGNYLTGGKRNGYQYRAQNNGTTGSTQPSWPAQWGSNTAVDGTVTWKAEFEFEDGTSPAWASTTAYAIGDIRLPSTRNGLRMRCIVAGTSGSTMPLFISASGVRLAGPLDHLQDGTVTWQLEYDVGSENQSNIIYPYNCDYNQIIDTDFSSVHKGLWIDNIHGQAREFTWRNVNYVATDYTLYSASSRYNGEHGSYAQIDWDGGESATTMGVKCIGNGQDFFFKNLHVESGGRMVDVYGPGANVVIENCRVALGTDNYPRGGEWSAFGVERLTIDNTKLACFGHPITFALTYGASYVQTVCLRNTAALEVGVPFKSSSAARTVSNKIGPWRCAAGQTLNFALSAGGVYPLYPSSHTFTATLQSGDVVDMNDVRAWEWARRINLDCGRNWEANKVYAVSDVVVPGTVPGYMVRTATGELLEMIVSSTSGTGTSNAVGAPVWPTTIGGTVTDNPGANQVVWTARRNITPALFAFAHPERRSKLFVELKGRGSGNDFDTLESPPVMAGTATGLTIAASPGEGTAQRALYVSGGGGSYTATEAQIASGGVCIPAHEGNAAASRNKVELTLDSFCLANSNNVTERTRTGRWIQPAVSTLTATQADLWTSIDERQVVLTTMSGTVVPLRNTGGTFTFSGDSQYAPVVFDRPEWDTNYIVQVPLIPSAKTGSPAAATSFSIVKKQHGFTARRQPATGAGTSESYQYELRRVSDAAFNPSKCTSATLKAWYKNESLSVGLNWATTGWVNSATGTNLIGPLLQATGAKQPTIALDADGVYSVTFDGTDDFVQAINGGSALTQPLTLICCCKVLEVDTAASKYIIAQGLNAITWAPTTAYSLNQRVTNGYRTYICTTAGTSAGAGGPTGTGTGIADNTVVWNYVDDSFILEYYGSINSFYPNTGTRISAYGQNMEDDYHVLAWCTDNTQGLRPLTLGASPGFYRGHMIVDNGTKTFPTGGSSGSNGLSGLTLCSSQAGTTHIINAAFRGDICIFEGQMNIEEKRKVIQYMMAKAGK